MGGFKRIIRAMMITNIVSRKKISSSSSKSERSSSSFPGLKKSKGTSDIELCQERLQLPILAMHRWLALGDAYKKNCDLHSAIAASIKDFIVAHSEKEQQEHNRNEKEQEEQNRNDDENSKVGQEEGEKEEPLVNDATEEEESVSTTSSKGRKNKNSKHKNRSAAPQHEPKDDVIVDPPHIASSSNYVGPKAFADKGTLVQNLEDLVAQKIEDDDMKKILESSDISTLSAKSSSHTLLRSWSRRLSSTFIPTLARSSRKTSSKVRSAPSDVVDEEKDKKHSSYLDELGQWENKLYEEIEKGKEGNCKVKVAQFVFNEIQLLRDEKLLPHLDELQRCIQSEWDRMQQGYANQKNIMEDIKELYKPRKKMYCEASQNHAAKKLKAQLVAWRLGFTSYLSAQKEYVEALQHWGRHQVPSFCEVNDSKRFSSMLKKWIECLNKVDSDVKGLKVMVEALESIEGKVGELLEFQKKEHEDKSQVQKLRQDEWNQVQKIELSKEENEKDELEKVRQLITEKEKEYETSRNKTEVSARDLVQKEFKTLFESLESFSCSVGQKYVEINGAVEGKNALIEVDS